jgi:hypothetical protein
LRAYQELDRGMAEPIIYSEVGSIESLGIVNNFQNIVKRIGI